MRDLRTSDHTQTLPPDVAPLIRATGSPTNPPPQKRGREESRAVEETAQHGIHAAEEAARRRNYAAMARAESSACDDVTEPKMPPCALIIARPASWKCGKYEPQQSESTMQR
jgi:hypothetical protein